MNNYETLYNHEKDHNERMLHIFFAFRELISDDVRKSINKRHLDNIIKAFIERIDQEYTYYLKTKEK